MADDKRPLLNQKDDNVSEKSYGAVLGHPVSHTESSGLSYPYDTWGESSGARQEPGSSQLGKRLFDPATSESSDRTSAPTAASIGDSFGASAALPDRQNLCINSTSDEILPPVNCARAGPLPESESQGLDNFNSSLSSSAFTEHSEASTGLNESLNQRKKLQDCKTGSHDQTPNSGENLERSDAQITSDLSGSNRSTSPPGPSSAVETSSDRHLLNIKNQLKRPRPRTPGLRSGATPEIGADLSESESDSSDNREANMEHNGHFKNAKKPANIQDKDKEEKTPFFVYYLACFATIGGLLFGYDTGIVSGSMLLIKDYFHLSTIWQELIVSATVGAAAVFSIVAGFMCDFFGRKVTIMIASVVFVAGAIVMGASENKEMLMAGRIVVGIGIGFASMTVPVYVAEAAPPAIRGRLVTLNQLFITIGILISSIIAGAFSTMKETGWRYMLALAGVPGIIQFIGFIYLPESPRWLVMKGKDEQALKVLQRIRGKTDVQAEIDEIKQAVDEDSKNEGLVLGRVFKTAHVRKALFVGCGLQVFQQLCGINTVIYYSATILKMAGFPPEDAIWLVLVPNGINFCSTIAGVALVERLGRKKLMIGSFIGVLIALAVLAIGFQLSANFSPDIHNENHNFSSLYQNDTCFKKNFTNCEKCIEDTDCGFCFTGDGKNGACLRVLDGDEDKYSNIGLCNETNKSPMGMKFSHEYCPTDYTWMAVLGLALFVMAFAPGLGPMPWTINSEIYPMWARSTGNSLATGCNWICNLVVSLFFLTLTEEITKYGAFWLFAGICFLGLLFTLIFVPETKNKSLEEVEDLFRGKKKRGSDNVGYEREIPSPDTKDITRL